MTEAERALLVSLESRLVLMRMISGAAAQLLESRLQRETALVDENPSTTPAPGDMTDDVKASLIDLIETMDRRPECRDLVRRVERMIPDPPDSEERDRAIEAWSHETLANTDAIKTVQEDLWFIARDILRLENRICRLQQSRG